MSTTDLLYYYPWDIINLDWDWQSSIFDLINPDFKIQFEFGYALMAFMFLPLLYLYLPFAPFGGVALFLLIVLYSK